MISINLFFNKVGGNKKGVMDALAGEQECQGLDC